MSVNTTENVKSYACDGSTTDFDFPYKITGTDTSVLIVTIWEDATSTPTILAEESGAYSYSVAAPNNNYENGGTISTTKLDGAVYGAYAWSSDYTITIERIVPYTQPSEFAAAGLDNKALEQTFDNLEYQIQQLDKRKSIYGPASDPTGINYELQMISARALKALGCDASGNIISIVNVPTSGVTATPFAETLLDDTTVALARGTLELDKDDTVEFQTLRTVESPINVKHSDFGALGNDSDNDTTAIQAAIDAGELTHGTVYFPPGIYPFTNLVIDARVRLKGAGAVYRWIGTSATILKHTGVADAITIDNATAAHRGSIVLEDFELIPSVSEAGQHGISLVQTSTGSMRGIELNRLAVRDFGGSGIYASGTVFDVTLNRVLVEDNVGDGIKVVAGVGTPSQWKFYDCFLLSENGVWAANIRGSVVGFFGGTIAAGSATAKGLRLYCGAGFLENLNIEGVSIANTIGLQFLGDGCVAVGCTIIKWATGIQIGDGGATSARGFYYNGDISGANYTYDVHVTSGGLRFGTRIINRGNNHAAYMPVYLNDRGGDDGVYGELYIEHDKTHIFTALADDATPSVAGLSKCLSGGTTTITDFDDGICNQVIRFIAEDIITITDGTNIFLNGSANFDMNPTDTLTLICKADNKWYELGRSDNT